MAFVSFETVYDALQAQGYRPRKCGKGYKAHVPGREDRTPSLSLTRADDGSAILKDFGGRLNAKEILAALGLSATSRPFIPSQTPAHMHTSAKPSPPDRHGLTLAQYAQAKRLPEEFLRSLGLEDVKLSGAPAVRMPYIAADGRVIATRYRTALAKEGQDNRFRWKAGDKPHLYGLWRLEEADKAAYALLVEGESCSQTLWHAGFPALGIPGATMWKHEFTQDLAAVPTLYLVVEPDGGGEKLLADLSVSDLKSRLHLVRLDGFKDASEMYLDDPTLFGSRMKAALAQAEPLAGLLARAKREAALAAAEHCRDLVTCPSVLAEVVRVTRQMGVVGEDRAVKILYLAMVSRVLERPISVAVKGPSSAGKSFTVDQVLKLFPGCAYYELTSTSEKALMYTKEPLSHRMLVMFEAEGMTNDFTTYAIRSLLSEGRVRYATVDKTKDGLVPRNINIEGPTGLLTTTTSASLHSENETRLISLPITDTPEQTSNVFLEIAGKYRRTAPDLERWHALQAWLEGSATHATVPFAEELAKLMPNHAVRLRRDFTAILSLIEVHAILHQERRELDEDNRVVATLEDYAIVFDLYDDLIATQTETRVRPGVARAVQAVRDLCEDSSATTIAKVAAHTRIDRSVVSRDLAEAEDRGYVKLLEARTRAKQFVPGEPLPANSSVLPSPAQLRQVCTCACAEEGKPITDAPAPEPREEIKV